MNKISFFGCPCGIDSLASDIEKEETCKKIPEKKIFKEVINIDPTFNLGMDIHTIISKSVIDIKQIKKVGV